MTRLLERPRPRAPLARFVPTYRLADLLDTALAIRSADPAEVAAFEAEFAAAQGLKRAFFLPSARLGVYLALKGLGLPEGSRVLLPAWTHPSVPAMVVAAGCVPRIADISPGTFTMGPQSLTERHWEGVRAVIATHLYGCPAPVPALAREAAKRGAVLLEDCAQGYGAHTGQARAGAAGAASFYSFNPTKNLTTLGGGMVGVQDEALAQRLEESLRAARPAPNSSVLPALARAAAMWAATTRPGFAFTVRPLLAAGWTLAGRDLLHPLFDEAFTAAPPRVSRRPSPVQARLGRRLLRRMDEHNRRRHENGLALLARLEGLGVPGLPEVPAEGRHIFMSFVMTHPDRTTLARRLFARGVDTSPGYMRPVTRVRALAGRVEQFGPCPVAERLDREQLHLPVYPDLTQRDLDGIAQAVARSIEYRIQVEPERALAEVPR